MMHLWFVMLRNLVAYWCMQMCSMNHLPDVKLHFVSGYEWEMDIHTWESIYILCMLLWRCSQETSGMPPYKVQDLFYSNNVETVHRGRFGPSLVICFYFHYSNAISSGPMDLFDENWTIMIFKVELGVPGHDQSIGPCFMHSLTFLCGVLKFNSTNMELLNLVHFSMKWFGRMPRQ